MSPIVVSRTSDSASKSSSQLVARNNPRPPRNPEIEVRNEIYIYIKIYIRLVKTATESAQPVRELNIRE